MSAGVAMQRSCREGGRVKLDFGGNDFLALDGQMVRDARRAGLWPALLVILDFKRRSWFCGHGGIGLFFRAAGEKEFELLGIELLTGYAEDATADGIDGLAQHQNLGSLTFDDGIALGDFIEQVLFPRGIHCWQIRKQSTCQKPS